LVENLGDLVIPNGLVLENLMQFEAHSLFLVEPPYLSSPYALIFMHECVTRFA
jgi:hypothetical protein